MKVHNVCCNFTRNILDKITWSHEPISLEMKCKLYRRSNNNGLNELSWVTKYKKKWLERV